MSSGDIVGIIDANSKPSSKTEFSGIVYWTTSEGIIVSFKEMVELDKLAMPLTLCMLPNDVTYHWCKEAVKCLSKFNSENPAQNWLKLILCGEMQPSTDWLTLPGSFTLDSISSSLNPVQKNAVMECLTWKDIAVVHGPPGTGKTTTIVEFIKQACKV